MEVTLRDWYGGYAPGTEFRVIRRHAAPVYTVIPTDQPFRGLTIPINYVEVVK